MNNSDLNFVQCSDTKDTWDYEVEGVRKPGLPLYKKIVRSDKYAKNMLWIVTEKLKLSNKQLLGLFVCVCALQCAQLLHTILHRTDLIIFPLILQTISIAPMMFIMVALRNRADHYIFMLFLLFFPRLISAVGDWMFTTLRHMVWP